MVKSDIISKIFNNETFNNSIQILDHKDPTNNINNNNEQFNYVTPIIQTTFKINCIPPNGILINYPGNYVFSQNIIWKPINDSIAITINCNSIVLDLCNYNLICNKNNGMNNLNLIGISVLGVKDIPLSNISIMNGKIINTSYYGMKIYYCDGLNLNNIIICNLKYCNLQLRNLTPTGIFIQLSNNLIVSNCKIKNIDVKTDSSAGIQLIECTNGIIKNCNVKNLKNRDGAVQGYSYIGCENITTLNCASCNFRSYFIDNILTTGHTVLGFCPILCSNLLYEKCKATNMTGCCDDVHGISVFLNIYVQLINFTVNHVIGGKTKSKSCAKSTGIEIYGLFVKVINCNVKNIFAIRPQDKQCSGFASAGYDIQFTNCFSSNVKVLNSHNDSKWSDIKYGIGVGYGWAPDPRPIFKIILANNITYKNCTSTDCQVGFDTFNHNNSLWYKIKIINCNKSILHNPNEIRILSCDECSECNPSIITELKNICLNNKFKCIK